jgi:hypothetical protein
MNIHRQTRRLRQAGRLLVGDPEARIIVADNEEAPIRLRREEQ